MLHPSIWMFKQHGQLLAVQAQQRLRKLHYALLTSPAVIPDLAPCRHTCARSTVCSQGRIKICRVSSGLVADHQLRHASDHLRRLDICKAGLFHHVAHICWVQAKPIRIDGHVLQGPKSSEKRSIQGIVHHEAVDDEHATWLKPFKSPLVKHRHSAMRHRLRDVRNECDIMILTQALRPRIQARATNILDAAGN